MIEHYLDPTHYDLVTPDAILTELARVDQRTAVGELFIEGISPAFVGFDIDPSLVFFNLKSTLAQLGINGEATEYELDAPKGLAEVKVTFTAYSKLAEALLGQLQLGTRMGKLFAADDRRRVRDPEYLSRMFGRSDRFGRPLLSLGGLQGSQDLILDKVDGRTVAYLTLQNGKLTYDEEIFGFLPTILRALERNMPVREYLRLHQQWHPTLARNVEEGDILLVRTLPLHIRTVFARVVDNLLAEGYHHTTASVLDPSTSHSGDIYELYGTSKRELADIPLEFYTLEPFREYVFFSDRDQLQSCLEDDSIFSALKTAPKDPEIRSATFVVKGTQLLSLREGDWISCHIRLHEMPGLAQASRQALMVDRYIEQQPETPILRSIEAEGITSQGILLSRYFPSPFLKRLLLSDYVQQCLKALYFSHPSFSGQDFFSQEDRALLHDLYVFAIPVYWVDESSGKVLQYVEREGPGTGMFVPNDKVETFLHATIVGIYGSNLIEGDFEGELQKLLQGLQTLQKTSNHKLLNPSTELALLTGGGPGAMELGNRVAKELNLLSCANIVDFRKKGTVPVNEQLQNPYVEAKMTYRLDRLVERQAEFHLDLPIFVVGGIGTDFEYALEEVRRKVGAVPPTPILLFGSRQYWKRKLTERFSCNLESGTIKGSEWLSNCMYSIQTAEQGLAVLEAYFTNELELGPKGPVYEAGFAEVGKTWGVAVE